jgi:hypothetical protein
MSVPRLRTCAPRLLIDPIYWKADAPLERLVLGLKRELIRVVERTPRLLARWFKWKQPFHQPVPLWDCAPPFAMGSERAGFVRSRGGVLF